MDALTIHEGPEDEDFAFDDLILNSKAYRAAFKRQRIRNVHNKAHSESHSASLKQLSSSNPSIILPSSGDTFTNYAAISRKTTNGDSETLKEDSLIASHKTWKSVPLTQTIRQEKLYGKLCTAAGEGDLKLVEELINAGVSIEGHDNCLFDAIDSGSVDVVAFLLAKGANMNAVDRETGQACLHYALWAQPQNPEIFLTLLNAGARDDVKNIEEGAYNIFHSILWFKEKLPNVSEVLDPLLTLDAEKKLRNGKRLLFLRTRWPNSLKDIQYTPLELACVSFKKGLAASDENLRTRLLIQAFVDNGSSFDSLGNSLCLDMWSLLFKLTAEQGPDSDWHDVVDFLLQLGARPNVCDPKTGDSPLHVACRIGTAKIAQSFIHYGADVEAAHQNGRQPIHYAVHFQKLELVALLVEYGVST